MPLTYKLNPAVKLISIMLFTAVIFLVDKFPIIVFLVLAFIITRLLAKVPFRGIRYLKTLSLLAVFIIVIQTLFAPGENFILNPLFPASIPLIGGAGSLKWEGLFLGLVVVCRMSALIILFPVLSETTPPQSLALGLNSLGFPYRIAFIMTTAFNLLPVFKEDALVIMDAQKLRGMRHFEKSRKITRRYGRGKVFSRLKAYSGLALPLVLGAMKKAQVSSAAMDSRGFGVYKTRTWLEKPKIGFYDIFFILGCMAFSAGILFLNYLPDLMAPVIMEMLYR